MSKVREIVQYLLPHLVTAGRYSARIQKGVGTLDEKEGATIFHHALSDADLTIQSFLEVVLLARFPELSFFSEEQAHSLNAKYFPGEAELEIQIDPVDGTRSYIDGHPYYQIIVAFHDQSEMVGAVVFMPRRDRCFIGLKGEGAFVLSISDIEAGCEWSPLVVERPNGGALLVLNTPEIGERLAGSFDVVDVLKAYSETPGRYNFTDILDGTVVATINLPCQAIDNGAIAFIAQQAGAIVSDLKGDVIGSYRNASKRTVPEVLVAWSPEEHGKILSLLKGL